MPSRRDPNPRGRATTGLLQGHSKGSAHKQRLSAAFSAAHLQSSKRSSSWDTCSTKARNSLPTSPHSGTRLAPTFCPHLHSARGQSKRARTSAPVARSAAHARLPVTGGGGLRCGYGYRQRLEPASMQPRPSSRRAAALRRSGFPLDMRGERKRRAGAARPRAARGAAQGAHRARWVRRRGVGAVAGVAWAWAWAWAARGVCEGTTLAISRSAVKKSIV